MLFDGMSSSALIYTMFIADIKIHSDNNYYLPILFFNEFWLLRENMIPLNDSVVVLPLSLRVEPISQIKFMVISPLLSLYTLSNSVLESMTFTTAHNAHGEFHQHVYCMKSSFTLYSRHSL